MIAAIKNITYEKSAGIFEEDFYIPPDDVLYDTALLPPYPVINLTGYAAVGALMDRCDGNVIMPLTGSQPSPGVTDKIKFIVVPELKLSPKELDDGTTLARTLANAHGIRLSVSPVPDNVGWAYVNLVAPGGMVIPYYKGTVSDASCASGCC